MANKIDSNSTGLRYAEESSLGALPGSPVWYPLDPNSYSDFGGEITTVARDPINPSRQRKKGVTTDLDASGGFNQDLTQSNLTRMLQGFFFATARERDSTAPLNGTAVTLTNVDGVNAEYEAASGLGIFAAGDLLLASGFTNSGNNGLKVVVTAAAGAVQVGGVLTAEVPPAGAKLESVGFQFPSADLSVSLVSGNFVALNSVATNLTTLGLNAGDWIYVGGDGAITKFANNQGFARVRSVATNQLILDKTSWEGAVEAGTGKTIQLFMGTVIKNEKDPNLIVRRTYQLERTLGQDNDGTMSEYLIGAVPNELTVNVAQADKVTADLSFVAIDNEQRNGLSGVKSGSRPSLPAEDPAFNTSSDFSRIKLASVSSVDSSPNPLFAFATEMTLSINNNVTPNKAIAVLGAFDTTAGTFEIGGSLTAYFADIAAVQAVRNNADITLDMVMVKNNAGMVFDVPLLSLGGGRLNVEKDQSITLPLEVMGAESSFGHTLLFSSFAYLPSAAA